MLGTKATANAARKPVDSKRTKSKVVETKLKESKPAESNVENVDNEPKSDPGHVTEKRVIDSVTTSQSEALPSTSAVHVTEKRVMDSVTTARGGALPSTSDDSSFAPADYQFAAPSNLKEYFPKFTPLSPGSTAKFLLPSNGAPTPKSSRRFGDILSTTD